MPNFWKIAHNYRARKPSVNIRQSLLNFSYGLIMEESRICNARHRTGTVGGKRAGICQAGLLQSEALCSGWLRGI